MRVETVDIDLYQEAYTVVPLKQRDTTTLIVNVYAQEEPYLISNVILTVVRADGDEFTQRSNITIAGNTAEILLDGYILRDDGEIKLELIFKKNGARVSTYIFTASIEPTQYEDDIPIYNNAYTKPIAIADWILSDNAYIITIPSDAHNLSTTAYVAAAERLDGNDYIPVSYMYNRELDGTVRIISDIPYAGRIVLRR